MINIVLFGPPGAGKGTQSEKLVKEFGLAHLSTGDVFRYHIKNQTELGELAKSYIDKGELVPDEVTINLLKAEIEKSPAAKGYIFDGFPRTVPQAIALDNMLAEKNNTVTMMISLIVEEEELVKRLLSRGQDSGRTDDTDESIIRNRIRVYNEQTAIAAEFYKKQNKYFEIRGKGVIEDIYSEISQLIKIHNQTS
jgi:adenylate kinase